MTVLCIGFNINRVFLWGKYPGTKYFFKLLLAALNIIKLFSKFNHLNGREHFTIIGRKQCFTVQTLPDLRKQHVRVA